MKSDKFRILVDWDRDGFSHTGVPLGTPANLVPNPYFMLRSNVRGTSITGHEEPVNRPEIVKDLSNLGFQYAKLTCGGSNSKRVWVGMIPLHYAQPLPSDIKGTSGSTLRQQDSFGGRWEEVKSPYGQWARHLASSDFYVIASLSSYFGAKRSGTLVAPTSQMTNFPVVAGTQYRFSYWHRFDPTYGGIINTAFNVKSRIGYISTAANPVFTEVTNSTTAVTPDGVWRQVTLTFTAPVGQTFAVMKLEASANTFSGGYYVAGMSIYPVASNPAYMVDPAVVYDTNQFNQQLKANTTYNYSFYAKADSFDKIGIVVQGVDIGTSNWTQLLSEQQSAINGTWTRFSVSFTTGSNPQFGMLQITPYVGVNPASAGVTGNMYVRAFQLTEGTKLYPLHVGVTTPYDDVSDYVVDFAYKFGKKSLEEPMPYEGTLDFTLNNESRLFSPANTTSPLYGMFNQGCKIILQIKHPTTGVWSNLWGGWFDSVDITAGLNSDMRVKVHCKQGIFRLRDGQFAVDVSQYVPFKTMVQNIIKAGSWRAIGNAYEGVLGFNARLGENFYVSDTTAAFKDLDNGVNVYDLQGLDWGRNTTTEEALNDLLSAENGNMWIDRDGLITIRNRNFWVSRHLDPDVIVSLDTKVQQADYAYARDLINSYEVEYQPAKFNTNQIVWQTKGSLLLGAGKTRNVALVFSLPEGRVKTVANIQNAIQLTVYDKDPVKYPSNPAVVDSAVLNSITATINQQGSRYYMNLVNGNSASYYIVAVIKGDALDTGDKLAGSYSDRDSIEQTVSVRFKHASNPVISSTDQAEAIAKFFVSRNADAVGEFNRIKIVDDGTVTTHDLFMSMKIGAVLKIKESQTGETSRTSAVVEEAGYYNGGSFAYDATLDKLDPKTYARLNLWTLDDSNGAASVNPVGVKMAKAVDALDGAIPVKELSFGRRNGWFYFVDNPLTVRSFGNDLAYIAGLPVVSQDYDNMGANPVSATGAYFGAKKQDFTFDIATENPLMSAGSMQFETKAEGLPYIRVLPETYYKWLVTGTYPLSLGSAESYGGGGQGGASIRPFLGIYANKNNSLFHIMGAPTYWGYVGGVRTLEGYTSGAGQGLTDNILGLGENTDVFEYRMHTRGSANYFQTPMDRTKLNVMAVGLTLMIGNFYDISLVQWSDLKNCPIDSTKSYKYAVWIKTAPLSSSVSYTLELFDVNHVLIASAAVTPNAYSVTKLEVSLPSGYDFVTARLRKTSNNSEAINDKLWLYGTALTENSLVSYTDIPEQTGLLYI